MAGIRKKSPERKTAIREFAKRFYFDNQRSPSMTEIAAELKISRSTAYEYPHTRSFVAHSCPTDRGRGV